MHIEGLWQLSCNSYFFSSAALQASRLSAVAHSLLTPILQLYVGLTSQKIAIFSRSTLKIVDPVR
jgi:hypothetical protein